MTSFNEEREREKEKELEKNSQNKQESNHAIYPRQQNPRAKEHSQVGLKLSFA